MQHHKPKTPRVIVYFDGSNFFYKMRSRSIGISDLVKFDYLAFAKWLAGSERSLIAVKYYVGVVRAKEDDEKGQSLRKEQQKLFDALEKSKIEIKRGFIMENDGVYHEKGVDVQIATDMLIDLYHDKYDIAIMISSDTDLLPAVEEVLKKGKKVEYIGFTHNPSYALKRFTSTTRLLKKEDLDPFATKEVVAEPVPVSVKIREKRPQSPRPEKRQHEESREERKARRVKLEIVTPVKPNQPKRGFFNRRKPPQVEQGRPHVRRAKGFVIENLKS